MVNYAEDLTYWYLRLNGFFLLRNFVMHNLGEGQQRGTVDYDLLAVRFPYVCEEIDGQQLDWDGERFNAWNIEIDKFHLAFIVEVKSGINTIVEDLERAFSNIRLEKAIMRFGIFEKKEVHCIVKELSQRDKYIKDHWVIAKLAVTEKESKGSWLNLLLKDADKFIQKRIESYPHDKHADRIYFPDTIMQYMTWKIAGHPRRYSCD